MLTCIDTELTSSHPVLSYDLLAETLEAADGSQVTITHPLVVSEIPAELDDLDWKNVRYKLADFGSGMYSLIPLLNSNQLYNYISAHWY